MLTNSKKFQIIAQMKSGSGYEKSRRRLAFYVDALFLYVYIGAGDLCITI